MRALTIKQPWAYAILRWGKRVENRTTYPPEHLIGQRIALHAGKSWSHKALDWMLDHGLVPVAWAEATQNRFAVGAIVGTAVLVGWAEKRATYEYDSDEHDRAGLTREQAIQALDSPWYMGRVAVVLGDVRELAVPVPCRGQIGYWTLSEGAEAWVLAQEAA